MMTRKRIGTMLKHLRESAELTQSDLSSAIGVSVPVISRIENGIREPHASRFWAWVEACGHTVTVAEEGSDTLSLGEVEPDDKRFLASLIAAWPNLHPLVKAQLRAQFAVLLVEED